MAEFTQTTTYEVHCPACECDRVIRVGVRNGQQRYQCKECSKKFRANGKATGRRMDAELMGSAIRDFYTGKSYKQICEGLRDEYGHSRTKQGHHLRVGARLYRPSLGGDGEPQGPDRRPLGSRRARCGRGRTEGLALGT